MSMPAWWHSAHGDFVSLRLVVVVVPVEVYPVSRVVVVRVGKPALREREEIYEYGAERRVRVGPRRGRG